MKNAILHFFGKQNDGTIPWDFYIKDFKREDFGLALRIEEDLGQYRTEKIRAGMPEM